MRGIEAALDVLRRVEKGAFAAEELRGIWDKIGSAGERKLAASLVYITLRKQGLWRHLLTRYSKRPPSELRPETAMLLRMGIAGVLELKHFRPGPLVSAVVQRVKADDEGQFIKEASLANAVLRTVGREGQMYVETLLKSPAMRDIAMACGVPGWAAAAFAADLGMAEAKRIVRMHTSEIGLSVRLASPEDRPALLERVEGASAGAFPFTVRIDGNPFPAGLPGYEEGRVTPQTESSVWAAESLIQRAGGRVLDMCVGRGVKAGQILARLPEARLEGWDISGARVDAARAELARVGVADRAELICGDALRAMPRETPDAILLDAPCTGSGTWRRHPEAKWRLAPENVRAAAELQRALFLRAADLVRPGGVIMYCTCSLFRAENEDSVGAVLAGRRDLSELPACRVRGIDTIKGRPYGTLVLPSGMWIDGFYVAIFRKKV